MLAAILAARNDYSDAAEQLRDYLKYAREGGNREASRCVDEVRGQLAELEKRLAAERR